jgi:hypothetical protein
MRNRHLAAVAVTASLAALTGLAQAVPPLSPAPAAAAVQGGTGGPPPPRGGSYAHSVYAQITITGDHTGGNSINIANYPGPRCWLVPRFTGAQSWQPGDPIALTPSGDADEYWWWFAQIEPAFAPAISHNPDARRLINHSFKAKQGQDGWWWVPAWLSTSDGEACALGMVGSLGLNNGFENFASPQNIRSGNQHSIDGRTLAEMARAALRLPHIRIHTNPARGKPADVNLPVWAWLTYNGNPQPTDQATLPIPGGVLQATVTTSVPHMTIKVDAGDRHLYNNCGSAGSKYQGGNGAPPCGVTFYAPSTGGPYTITATVTWTVSWSDNQGGAGVFRTPPAQVTALERVTVREIQAINGPGGSATPGG